MDSESFIPLFGAYDIRGIVGENLNGEVTRKIAQAYGKSISPNRSGIFLIGHDGRVSSPALAESFSVGLREAGHQVVHLGQATTPMIYWCGAEGKYDGSVCVTASHLPPEHNGFKLCRQDAIPLSGEHGLPEIIAEMKKDSKPAQGVSKEIIHQSSLIAHYATYLRSFLHPDRPLKVAVDAGNGVGGIDTALLFDRIENVNLIKLCFYSDGTFPERSPNPLEPGALAHLSKTVVENKCDFGLAFDGDADRAVVVDEKGDMVPPDYLGGIIAMHFLKSHPGATVLYDLRATRAFAEVVRDAGGVPIRSRVGHAFVKAAMREQHAIFAAELSGHYYYADLHFTDSGLRTLIELCNLVSEQNAPLSELTKPFHKYATSGEINQAAREPEKILKSLAELYKDGKMDHLDGLSVDYADWWFNVRASQTEPVIRLNIGAVKSDMLLQKQQTLLSQIRKINS